MHAAPDLAPFSTAQAIELGWSRSSLVRATRDGRAVRIRRSQYCPATPDDYVRAIAAAKACCGSVVSHKSAAVGLAVPLLGWRDFRPDLTLSPPSTGDTVDALLHRASLRPHDVVFLPDGTPCTSPARTVVDLGRSCSLDVAVVAIDYVLHEGLATREDLADVADFCRRWPGIRKARAAIALADGRTESPLESISRLAIGRLQLAPPEPQVTVYDERGQAIGRLDFYWDEPGVGGEADGRSKYADRDVLNDEKDRHELLEDVGLEMARWRWWHAQHPAGLRTKIENARVRGLARDSAGLPRLWSVRPSPLPK